MINDRVENIPFAFFGSSRLSVIVLDELTKLGYVPNLIVTTPDKPQGRKLIMTPNVVKVWANSHNIEVVSPAKLDSDFIATLEKVMSEKAITLFIVASYGKIIPTHIIDMPKHKTLNIHPSLLPQYRGASPLPTAMLEDTKVTGVSIMQLDAEMDHGPICAQKKINLTDNFKDWPTYEDFEEFMAIQGAKLLAEIMPDWVAGKIISKEQDHKSASYTKKIIKEDAELTLSQEELRNLSLIPPQKAYEIFRKIQAYHEWPQAFFFIKHKDSNDEDRQIRVKITQASFVGDNKAGRITIEKVIPEGKKEMSYESFIQGYI